MPITDYQRDQQRQDRNKEKIFLLLNFLKEETYSDKNTITRLFTFKNHKSFYSLVNKLTKDGLVEKYSFCSTVA